MSRFHRIAVLAGAAASSAALAAPGGLDDLALDPDTHAVWGAGLVATKAGSVAVIFADGRVG